MKTLVELFCDVDDFCQAFVPAWQRQLLESGVRQRCRESRMSLSEIMTLLIAFHSSHQRDFKNYYTGFVAQFYKRDFPTLLSDTRFLEVMPRALGPLCAYFTHLKGRPTGIEFVDSTTLKVCRNLRIPRHKVLQGVAQRGRSSMGWFYGFKLHLIVNHTGEIVSVKLTPGNVDDRTPVPELAQGLVDRLYGDKGYISQALSQSLRQSGVTLITSVRKNMKAKAISAFDKAMLAKRFIIETINDQLKNISHIEHARHRSLHGFMLNLIGGLIAYCRKKDKPSVKLSNDEYNLVRTCA